MPPISQIASLALNRRLMSNASRDFVSVDMRGMKAALVALARTRRVGVSAVVRTAVARELGLEGSPDLSEATVGAFATDVVKGVIADNLINIAHAMAASSVRPT
jgi:hypothetical protein